MHIFIDETGNFLPTANGPKPSFVGALIIPDFKLAEVFSRYEKIRRQLPKKGNEVKGSGLNPKQVAAVVEMLRRNNVLFHCTGIEMSIHTAAGIEIQRAKQADALTANLTDEHHPNFRAQILEIRDYLESLTPQLYVQTQVLFHLLRDTIEHCMMYWSQRHPQELGKLAWVVDAKGDKNKPTNWEKWWSLLILPWMQNETMNRPFGIPSFGDFSHAKHYELELSAFMRAHTTEPEKAAASFDIKKLLTENLTFDGTNNYGLELVDIVTNATGRAFTGWTEKGWGGIPSLMIHRANRQYLTFIAMQDLAPEAMKSLYPKVVAAFKQNGRSMIAPRFR